MSAVWAAIVGLFQSLVQPIAQVLASLAIFNAGKTAADDTARKAQDDAQAKADAAREAADIDAARNPGSLRRDDGFERAD